MFLNKSFPVIWSRDVQCIRCFHQCLDAKFLFSGFSVTHTRHTQKRKNCALWPSIFHFDPRIRQAGLISFNKRAYDPQLENPRENPGFMKILQHNAFLVLNLAQKQSWDTYVLLALNLAQKWSRDAYLLLALNLVQK